jgi:hypothetical protein
VVSLLFAGMTVLMIGDSHMTQNYLISTLHDSLMQQGARVYSYGACGSPAGDWMKRVQPSCGSAFRLDKANIRNRVGEAGSTRPLPDMVKEYHPDLIVVVNGDDMAAYKSPSIPKTWVWNQVSTLTTGIKDSGASCVWVGPAWGSEGGTFGKTFDRVKKMSDYLAEIVSPCVYINSLKMSKPGEWRTEDGVHITPAGYQAWGEAITNEIVSSDILKKIKVKSDL